MPTRRCSSLGTTASRIRSGGRWATDQHVHAVRSTPIANGDRHWRCPHMLAHHWTHPWASRDAAPVPVRRNSADRDPPTGGALLRWLGRTVLRRLQVLFVAATE